MEYKYLLTTGDFKLSSAQGVRYTSLYSNHSTGEKNINLVYSSRSDKLEGWESYIVKQLKFPLLIYYL